jgi:calcineurin-like phosphoesterase family protein
VVYLGHLTHFGHSNICRATTKWTGADNVTRDFKSLDHMNDTLVNNINEVVGEDDILIHLGDWSFGGFENIELFRNRINCKNVHLVLGNHDGHIERNRENIQSVFSSVNHYIKLDVRRPSQKGKGQVDKFNFVLCHFPIASWDGLNDGVIHIHGHVHLPPHHRVGNGKSLDVGVDGNNLKPIDLDEVLRIMNKQPISSLSLPRDHHVKRLI